MRYVVHTEIEPSHKIFLLKGLAIEVLGKVNDGIFGVIFVVWVTGGQFGIFSLGDVEVVSGEALGVEKIARVLDGEVHAGSALGWHDTVSPLLAVLVSLVLVDDHEHGSSVVSPFELAVILALEVRSLEVHGGAGGVGPRVFDILGNDLVLGYAVGGTHDVKVGFEV